MKLLATVVALTCGVLHAAPAHAQAALLGPGAAYIGVGVSGIGTAELDDRLAARGYPTFGTTAGALNIGAYRRLSSGIMLGFEWHGLIIGEEEHNGRDVALAGGYATLGVGYAIPLSPHARIYPRFGIGGGGMALLVQSDADTVDFDDVLSNPQPATREHDPNLSRDGVVYDLGAGFELTRRRGSGALVGLRVGYLHAPFDSSWDLLYGGKVSDVRDGPDATISGPYIRVLIGGAWRR